MRGKIDDIRHKVEHPLAQSVAKAICLLQYVRSIHRTAENISATLHPAVDADSRLPEVKAALDALQTAHMVRLGDEGYRIPSPAEDDWERQRASLSPRPGDVSRLHAETVTGLWQPPPSHSLLDVKPFKAGLYLSGRLVVEGDIPVHLTLAEAGSEYAERVEEARKRSQTETKAVFWVAALDNAIDRETVELFRSKEILSRKERGAQTKDETALVAEEKLRQRRHQDELRRLIRQALLTGSIFFRGNDRSPDDHASEIGRTAARVLSQALPEVFDRFQEAAARVSRKDLESLMTTENLRGLTLVFSDLHLVRDQGGKPVFNTESGPLAEVLARACKVLDTIWPFLQDEPDFTDAHREHAEKLDDLMARETFFRELPAIDAHAQALEKVYQQCYEEVLTARTHAYQQAIDQLHAIPGWEALDAEQQDRVMEPLVAYTVGHGASQQSIPKLRADVDACSGRRDKAIENLMRMRDG